jgi:hypothetical protein
MHRDVEDVIERLRRTVRSAEALVTLAEDLHSCAYDRSASDAEKVSTTDERETLNPLTGDPAARRTWGRLVAKARTTDETLAGLRAVALNMLNVGEQRPDLRGTHISSADYARALKAQRRRDDRGEHTPARNIAQPRYPGRKSR